MKNEVLSLHEFAEWKEFAHENFKTQPRYVRDQCIDAKKYFSKSIHEAELIKALRHCLENRTFFYADLLDTYQYLLREKENPDEDGSPPAKESVVKPKDTPHIDVGKRSVESYTIKVREAI